MKTAVLFLVFNRLDTTRRVFEAIRAARPPRLYLASDGPRESRTGEAGKVQAVREFLLSRIDWDCEVQTRFREDNQGCRLAVSDAITWFFQHESEGIILEDDCLPDPTFFPFCESLLHHYRDTPQVMHISGNQFVPNYDNGASYYFAAIEHCWGWATWADRWRKFSLDLTRYDETKIAAAFPRKADRKYWIDILHRMQRNEIDSWAFPWTLNILAHRGYCINPSSNLVSNIGFGSDSTHTRSHDSPLANLPTQPIHSITHPRDLSIDQAAVVYICEHVFGIRDEGLVARTTRTLRRLLRRYYRRQTDG